MVKEQKRQKVHPRDGSSLLPGTTSMMVDPQWPVLASATSTSANLQQCSNPEARALSEKDSDTTTIPEKVSLGEQKKFKGQSKLLGAIKMPDKGLLRIGNRARKVL